MTCNVLASIRGERKKDSGSVQVSQSKSVTAVPGEMEAVEQARALTSRALGAEEWGEAVVSHSRRVGA